MLRHLGFANLTSYSGRQQGGGGFEMIGQSSTVRRGAMMALVATGAFLLTDMAYGAAPPVNISVNETISAGQSVPGTIDLTPYLSSGSQNFVLSNFVLTVTGAPPDVGSYSLVTNPYVLYAVLPVYTRNGYVYDDYYNRSVSEVDTDGVADTISVAVGANQNSASNSSTSSVGPYLETGETVTGSPTYGESFFITNTNIVVVSYGSVTDSLPISATADAEINQEKDLSYTIKGLTGTTDISDVSLSFTQTPIISAAPEPATWLMMLMGVGTIGVILRRQPKLKAPV